MLFYGHVDPNSLIKALDKIKAFFQAKDAFFYLSENYRIDKKAFWQSEKIFDIKEDRTISFMKYVLNLFQIKKIDKYIYEAENPTENTLDLKKLFDKVSVNNIMFVSIYDNYKNVIGILGCYDMERHKHNCYFLQEVSKVMFRCICNSISYHSMTKRAKYDTLTGLINQNNFYATIYELSMKKLESLGCIYIDVNGLHEVNNHLGHKYGDKMLTEISTVLKNNFAENPIFRIGGDEFVVLYVNKPQNYMVEPLRRTINEVKAKKYEISIGHKWRNRNVNVKVIIDMAEKIMQENKKRYYRENRNRRQSRMLDEKMEQIIAKKHDMDAFLQVLTPHFTGVYLVDLLSGKLIRFLSMPDYFKEILEPEQFIYANSLRIYAKKYVEAKYHEGFWQVTDYKWLEQELKEKSIVEFMYKKTDGQRFKLQILKIQHQSNYIRETMWIFSKINSDG